MKRIAFILAFGFSTNALSAGLPTESQINQLEYKRCGEGWVADDGKIITKTIFALTDAPINIKLEKIDPKSISASWSENDDIWDVIKSTLKSVACLIKGNCEMKTTNYFFTNHFNAGKYSPEEVLYYAGSNLFYDSYYSLIGDVDGRNFSHLFPVRGITEVTVKRYDETQLDSSGLPVSDTVGFTNQSGMSCSSAFVYVQTKPKVGPIISVNGQNLTSGVHRFKTSQGSIDQLFSKNASLGKSINYHWNISNLNGNLNYYKSSITTSPYVDFDLPYGGEYLVTVKAFDGTYYSSMTELTVYAKGSLCVGSDCYHDSR